ncbi:DHS-like NAD/FAD-binding domain-containing protein [Fistulina hepatica ATCC 64428]|uniref:DHS-like NAD/FAD-binding domain-containing protein n=1 Tax=Fistulina hepatica ATCC 64428 TaxID=1128425 RepID=A0A0D7A654_9AGAR|nr:DHS-like NAD/FAD-binding domain-containing protein [Fistulina hepatica ATCC 64428]
MEAFRKVLSTAKRVVILSGAGLSAASGIPTYRGPNGLWTTSFDPSKLSTPQGFKEDPGRVWQFFHVRRQMMMDARPNAAHRAIARLADPAVRRRLMPCVDAAPLHVTQNIDGLYRQEICATAEARFIEMHGSAFKTVCTQCQHVRTNFGERVLSPALDGVTLQEVAAATHSSLSIPISELPRCGGVGWTSGSNRYGRCGGLLRPAVVWFGEHPQALGELHSVLNWTDVLIVVGTSALVYPAAGFSKMVKNRGGTVAVFNLECTSEDDADFMFLGPCEETLARLVEGL